jgi:folate-binding protein YgfZ
MLSNDVLGRGPGEGCPAALLNVKGHVLALLRALVTKDAVLLEVPAGRLDLVERTLEHYRVAAPVRFRPRADSVLALLGPRAGEVLREAGVALSDLLPEAHQAVELAGQAVRVVRAHDLPSGYVLHVAREGSAPVQQALLPRAPGLSRSALDALRVEAGRPWYGPDVTEENLLHETGLLREYHSSTKGCYVGQEVIARLEARGGHVNKRLRGLRLAGPAAAGDTVFKADQAVGRVTTAAISPRLGPVALGYVHRDHAELGTALEVAGQAATVVALPME